MTPRPARTNTERRKADDHHDHRKGDEQEHEVQQPLEPESIQRDRMGSKCDERHSCDLPAALETEQRVDGLHSAVDTDQPFELVEWCRVDRLERITAQQQHVGGVDRADLGEQPARRRSGTRHGGRSPNHPGDVGPVQRRRVTPREALANASDGPDPPGEPPIEGNEGRPNEEEHQQVATGHEVPAGDEGERTREDRNAGEEGGLGNHGGLRAAARTRTSHRSSTRRHGSESRARTRRGNATAGRSASRSCARHRDQVHHREQRKAVRSRAGIEIERARRRASQCPSHVPRWRGAGAGWCA